LKTQILVPLALLFAVLCGAGVSSSQETQVPLDQGGKVTVVDKALEVQLGLFPEYEGFEEARLFQSDDSTFTLEILYRAGDKLQKVSRPLSSVDVLALRTRVSAAVQAKAPATGLDQSGRSAFLIGTALLSLGYYGWAVPYVLHADDGSTAGGLYMVTSGLGFFGPFLLTRHRSVTDAEATLSLYGATRGVVHGWCVSALLFGEDREARDTITSGMLTSFAEYAAGFVVADRGKMGTGSAEAVSAVGDFGLGLGWGAHYLIDRHNEKLQASAMLGGSGAGLLAGGLLARSQHYTRGDAYVLRAAGTLGAYVGMAASASASDDEKAAVASSMAGAVAGLGAGHQLLRGRDFTTGQGVLINLSQVAGALFAAGLLSITGTDTDPVWPYMAASSVGAAVGFWATYRSLGDKARTHGRESSGEYPPGRLSSLRLDVCPEGLLAYAGTWLGDSRTRGMSSRPAPILRLQYRF
jgi:hypothetical protein